MNTSNATVNRTIDMRWLRWGLAAIAFLLALIVVELSTFIGPLQPRAQAQLPDSGAQLNQLIDGQKQIQRTVQQILDHLKTGEIKVVAGGADKETRGTSAPASTSHGSRPTAKPSASATRNR